MDKFSKITQYIKKRNLLFSLIEIEIIYNKIRKGENVSFKSLHQLRKMESLWKKTEKSLMENKEEIKSEKYTEVCIIGGGITGITTAYYLTRAGKKVILLERGELADRATGNTTAKITSQHRIIL